ncbi:MAG TPA: hypothetical protein HA261_01715 [Methanosarcina sp.]|nr:hypothetical protein [Methanosarcina sp.]
MKLVTLSRQNESLELPFYLEKVAIYLFQIVQDLDCDQLPCSLEDVPVQDSDLYV